MDLKNVDKEKMFEIEIAKVYGQELVDKIKTLPNETTNDVLLTSCNTQKGKNNLIYSCNTPI
jgi:hypothetical protein